MSGSQQNITRRMNDNLYSSFEDISNEILYIVKTYCY